MGRSISAPLLFSAIAFNCGLLTALGWVFGVPHFLSLHEQWVTTKPITSACLILGGLSALSASVYAQLHRRSGSGWVAYYLPIFQYLKELPAIIMGVLVALKSVQVVVGLEAIEMDFVQSQPQSFTNAPGEPSWATLTAFGLLFALVFIHPGHRLREVISWVLIAIGGIPLLFGYPLFFPPFFWYWQGISTAMAWPTALGVFSLGLTYWRLYIYWSERDPLEPTM